VLSKYKNSVASEHNPGVDLRYKVKIYSIVQAVLREIDGNQFQDGGRGGHIENGNTPIFERNLPIALNTYTHNRQTVLLKIDGN
jgi:hypothetical protein